MFLLKKACLNKRLKIVGFKSVKVKRLLNSLNLGVGSEIVLKQEIMSEYGVKIKTSLGNVSIPPRLANVLLAHLPKESDKKIPLIEVSRISDAHVEKLLLQEWQGFLDIISLREGDEIRILYTIPPMTYFALIDGYKKAKFTLEEASVLWLKNKKEICQLACATTDKDFYLHKICPTIYKQKLDLKVGAKIQLLTVKPVEFEQRTGLVLYSKSVHLHLFPELLDNILVEEVA